MKYSTKFGLRAWEREGNYVVCNYVFRDKYQKMSKLFSYYGVVKCRRNLNFQKMDTAFDTGKNDEV